LEGSWFKLLCWISVIKYNNYQNIRPEKLTISKDKKNLTDSIFGRLFISSYQIYLIILEDLFNLNLYYISATRLGNIQGYNALYAAFYRLSPLVGIEKINILTISGIVSDFITQLIDLKKGKTSYYEIVKILEKNGLKGPIDDRNEEVSKTVEIIFIDSSNTKKNLPI